MSFVTMKVGPLREIAKGYGIEDVENKKKSVLLAELAEEGVTFEDYERLSKAEHVEDELPTPKPEPKRAGRPKKTADAKEMVVKMDRLNERYDVAGKSFTREHPFVVMTEEEAQKIFDEETGFRPATPREVQEYYG